MVAFALGKHPGERYPHAQAFAEDLDDIAAGRPPRHLERRRAESHGTLVSARTQPDELELEPEALEPVPGPPRRRPGHARFVAAGAASSWPCW